MVLKEIFRRFKRTSKEDTQDHENRIDDFAMLEDKEVAEPINEYSMSSGIDDDYEDEDDFDEVSYLDQLEEREGQEPVGLDTSEESYDKTFSDDESNEYEEQTYENEFEDEYNHTDTDLDSVWDEGSHNDWDYDENEFEDEEIPIQQHQAKHVSIVPLKEYQDLSHLNDVISRNKEMVSNEELIRRLDLFDSEGSELSKLDKIKKDYISSKIYSSDIQNLTQNYVDNIDLLIENTRLNLAEAHNSVLSIDYEERAFDILESDLDDVELECLEDISNNETKEEEAYQNHLNNFMEKQASELEAFKREQEQRLIDYKEEQFTKKQSNIEMYDSERTDQFEKTKEKMLAEGTYRQEQEEANKLNPLKRDMLNAFESELKEASKDMKSKLKVHLSEIREEIDQKEHEWKTEIHQEEMRNEEKHKRKLEEEKLRLKQQEFDLDRQERLENLKLKRQRLDDYNRADDQIHRDNETLRRELNEANLSQAELNKALLAKLIDQNGGNTDHLGNQTHTNNLNQGNQSNNGISGIYKYIMGSLGLVFIIVLSFFLLTVFQKSYLMAPGDLPTPEEFNVSQKESDGIERLTEELDLLRKELSADETVEETGSVQPNTDHTNKSIESGDTDEVDKESSDGKMSLGSLLLEGSFDEAIEMASSKEFDQITNEMRKQKALVQLVNFNRRFDTTFGKLDEYVLRDRIWSVFDELITIPEKHLIQMSSERRNDVVLYMYQNDFISYGDWLLEMKKEKINE